MFGFYLSTLNFWAAGAEQCGHLPAGCPQGDADGQAALASAPRGIKNPFSSFYFLHGLRL